MSEENTRLLFVMSGVIFGILAGGVAAKALWRLSVSMRGNY